MYPSDLTDDEWEEIRIILKKYYPPYEEHPDARKRRGRRMVTHMRDVMDAIFYISKTGCQWKFMPLDFPNWGTVRHHFERFKELGIWDKILHMTTQRARKKGGKEKNPTLGIVDSQSIKTVYAGEARGYDGNKKIKGRKRTIIVDVLGCILGVYVSSAQPHDTILAPKLIEETLKTYPSIKCFALDRGYRGTTAMFIRSCKKAYIIPESEKGKKVSKKRWIVERTFAWLGHSRRLAKDYEVRPDNAETFIKISGIRRSIAMQC